MVGAILLTETKLVQTRVVMRKEHCDFKFALARKSRPCQGTFARANQADRRVNLLHCTERLMPWLLDTGGCDCDIECFLCLSATWHFRSVHSRLLSNNLFAVSAAGCCVVRNLTTSSFREKLQTFFCSKSAIDSSVPFSKCLLLLYLTFKTMSKASFWRCWCCRCRSRKRCQHSTSGPITAKPLIDEDSCVIALAHGQTWDVLWCAHHARGLNCAS